MLNKFIFVFLLLNLIVTIDSYSQNTKKASKLYSEANRLYSVGDFDSAIDLFLKSLKSDPSFCPSIYKLGLSYKKKNLFSDFKSWFLIYKDKMCDKNKDDVNFNLGEIYFLIGDIDESKIYFDLVDDTLKFLNYSKYLSNIRYNLNNKDEKLLVFEKSNSIDRWLYQYSPHFDTKSSKLYFTVREGSNLFDDENVITASLLNNNFSDFKPYYSLNSENNEGTPSFSNDGSLMVFTFCKMDFKKNSCDLYFSRKINNSWSQPQKFDNSVNSSYWDSQPFIYQNKLFFVSNRPGGLGGRDIYYSYIRDDGSFSQAVNFEKVNSIDEEVSPFIIHDVIYFSSNRSDSYGGYDIFLFDDLKSKSVINVGASINSYLDETSIFLWDNFLLLTVEDNLNNNYKSEIVFGELIKPFKTLLKKKIIRTFDAVTNNEIESDLFVIIGDKRQKINTDTLYTDNFPLNSQIIAESKGYFPEWIKNIGKDTLLIYLNKLDKKITLKNIYFEFDSYELNDESKKYLTIISDWISSEEFKKIEISGHADNVGSEDYNFKLSTIRAKSVFEYIININPSIKNLEFKGYGNSVPIQPNYKGPENRRIEFKIIY